MKDYGIIYNGKQYNPERLNLEVYVNAAYSNDLNDRKLTQGWFIKLIGALIKQASKKQSIMVTSSTVAKYLAINKSAAQEAIKIATFLRALGYNGIDLAPIWIYTDSANT